MTALFRRKSATEDVVEPAAEPEPVPTKGYTPGKGKPTPKRTDGSKRKKSEVAPKDNKEARTRMRAKMRDERSERYAGMRAGDEKYLGPRDKGPVRRLVRDLVDARRNVGTYFFGGALLVIVGSMQTWPPPIRFGANILWLGLLVVMLLDAFLISRLIRRTVRDRYPDNKERMAGLFFYGVMRSVVFRRMRSPAAQVKVGDTV